MAPRDAYRAQVDLLIRCLPALARTPEFALKGGTAINLFLHDMPRLSFANQLFLALEARGHRVLIAPNTERFHRAKVNERENPEKQWRTPADMRHLGLGCGNGFVNRWQRVFAQQELDALESAAAFLRDGAHERPLPPLWRPAPRPRLPAGR